MPGRAVFRRGALRMHDAGTCGHPVDVARFDPLNAAQTVAMHHRAFKKIGHRGRPDMRMRPHVHALAGWEARRTEMVEKDKRSDHLRIDRRQKTLHFEATEILGMRFEQRDNGRGRAGVCFCHDRYYRAGGAPHLAKVTNTHYVGHFFVVPASPAFVTLTITFPGEPA